MKSRLRQLRGRRHRHPLYGWHPIYGPLAPEDCRIRIHMPPAGTLQILRCYDLTCFVENRGPTVLKTAEPNPVHISYHWKDPGTDAVVGEGLRMPLPESILPGQIAEVPFWLDTPGTPGDYLLQVTLVQHWVIWFDQLHELNAFYGAVRLVAGERPGSP